MEKNTCYTENLNKKKNAPIHYVKDAASLLLQACRVGWQCHFSLSQPPPTFYVVIMSFYEIKFS